MKGLRHEKKYNTVNNATGVYTKSSEGGGNKAKKERGRRRKGRPSAMSRDHSSCSVVLSVPPPSEDCLFPTTEVPINHNVSLPSRRKSCGSDLASCITITWPSVLCD